MPFEYTLISSQPNMDADGNDIKKQNAEHIENTVDYSHNVNAR
jgi:hypothetical protein